MWGATPNAKLFIFLKNNKKSISKTQVILGAKKVQLMSNVERLSGVMIQTQIARGRIFDADAAIEAARLAKQQILAGAASQMIALASAQKRGLIDELI